MRGLLLSILLPGCITLSSAKPQRELVLTGRRRFHSWWRHPSAADRAAAASALKEVGLDGLEHRSLSALSGGQGQRALLARALAQEADHLLLDEALSGVDQPTTEGLFDLFRALCDRGTTILVATHDLALARRRFDRVLAVNRTIQAVGGQRYKTYRIYERAL